MFSAMKHRHTAQNAPFHVSHVSPRRPTRSQTISEAIAFVKRGKLSSRDIAALSAALPRGDGRAVLVIPSVFRSDPQTSNLRSLLTQLGYRAFGWELGRNLGPTRGLMAGAMKRLSELSRQNGQVSIIGFSMGGLFARWLALEAPADVREIITVGSPVRQPLESAFVPAPILAATWRGQDLQILSVQLSQKLQVPATSLYSRCDGIVDWQSCCDPTLVPDAIEISCHHVLMPQDAEVFKRIAETLARQR